MKFSKATPILKEMSIEDEILVYQNKIDEARSKKNAIVHFWEYRRLDSVGHLSLTLSNGKHISFWPEKVITKQITGKIANAEMHLADDIRNEDRIPDDKVEIPSYLLKENLIVTWWESYKQETDYSLLTQNCAITVMQALEKGEFGQSSPNQHCNILKPCKLLQLLLIFCCCCPCIACCGYCCERMPCECMSRGFMSCGCMDTLASKYWGYLWKIKQPFLLSRAFPYYSFKWIKSRVKEAECIMSLRRLFCCWCPEYKFEDKSEYEPLVGSVNESD